MTRQSCLLRCCRALLRLFSVVVPSQERREWRAEWDAELQHRWNDLHRRRMLGWRSRMDLLHRVLGALPDAAWIRRQFTVDADAVHDVAHGVRMLRKSPGFTASAVLILAFGLGGTVAIVTILDTLLFRPLGYEDAERIVTLWQRTEARPGEREDVSPGNFLDWRDRARSFSHLAAAVPYSHDYTGGGEPEVFFGAQVTDGFWEAMGVRAALGRTFRPEEYVRGAERVVLISYGLWQRRFGANPAIVNTAISLDGEPWTVVGVLPKDFAPQLLPRPGELGVWTPKIILEHERRTRGSAWWNVVGRLRPGVNLDEARTEMAAISAALSREYPRTNEGVSTTVVTLREHLMGDVRQPLFVMLAAVVLVLAIGCANVANLLLARGLDREREFSIRSALGAGRGRLVRQLAAESLLLSAIAGVVGMALAKWTLRVIVALAPAGVLRLQAASIDGRIVLFALGLTTMTAVSFGLLPACQFSHPGHYLRERHASGGRGAVRRLLVAVEVALALVLVSGAGLLIRSFERLLAVNPGFSPHHVVALQVFAWDRNGRPDRARVFFETTLERIRALPRVQAAGAVSAMPFISANIDIKSPLEIAGRGASPDGNQRSVYVTITAPEYFETMSIPLRDGRYLDRHDTERGPAVAVVSEALKRREWPDESPVGRRLTVQWEGKPVEAEVVGVVGELRHERLDRAPRAEVFLPLAQAPFASMTYVVRGAGDPGALIAAAKREVWGVDPLQTFFDTADVERLVDGSVVRQRFSTSLMSAFALLALVLCATGIYGIISFTTARRTREIGVRMALGADAAAIRRMVIREGGMLIGVGVLAGLGGAFVAGRLIRTLLFEVRPGDPLTFAVVCVLLSTVGLVACYLPARRATRVDPLIALRIE
jgi:putative ABC transport system permease protein